MARQIYVNKRATLMKTSFEFYLVPHPLGSLECPSHANFQYAYRSEAGPSPLLLFAVKNRCRINKNTTDVVLKFHFFSERHIHGARILLFPPLNISAKVTVLRSFRPLTRSPYIIMPSSFLSSIYYMKSRSEGSLKVAGIDWTIKPSLMRSYW